MGSRASAKWFFERPLQCAVRWARACHKLFHNIQTGLVMDQMNIWVCHMQMKKKYQNTNTDKVRAGSVAGGINEEQLNSWVCQRPRLPWIRSNPLHQTRHNQHGSLGRGAYYQIIRRRQYTERQWSLAIEQLLPWIRSNPLHQTRHNQHQGH